MAHEDLGHRWSDHISPDNPLDRKVLQHVAPALKDATPGWVEDINNCIDFGSLDLNTTKHKADSIDQDIALYARNHLYTTLLGIQDESHELHAAFTKACAMRNHPLVPRTFFNAMRAITIISDEPIKVATGAPGLLTQEGRTTLNRYNLLQRVVGLLGITVEGSVEAAVADYPEFLEIGSQKLLALVRLGLGHTATTPALDHTTIGELHVKDTVESHFMAAIFRQNYRFGQTYTPRQQDRRQSVVEMRKTIYEHITDDAICNRLGSQTVKAFLRYRPPGHEAQDDNPALRHLVAATRRVPDIQPAIEEANAPIEAVTGKEQWVKTIRYLRDATKAERESWLENMNTSIAKGGIDIRGKRPEDPEYEEAMEARINVFRLLGWANGNHSLKAKCNAFMATEDSLTNPMNIVNALNFLESYGIPDYRPVLATYFEIIRKSLPSLEKAAAIISEYNLDVGKTIQTNPRLLHYGEARLRTKIVGKIATGQLQTL